MDVFVTSRNTLWTSFAIIYLWASSAFMFLLADATPYLIGAGLTAGLDLARHSPLDFSRFPRLERILGLVLILPRDHALHHADGLRFGNYGANIVWWDKLHGTYLGHELRVQKLGVDNDLSLARSLFWPFSASK
jgi:sterol desaturase/sphingolipid hydroxylase (fatty acid hydroxylase superfamily)